MFDGKFRVPIDKAVKPIGNGLRRTGLTPDHLTVMGLLVAVGAAVAIGAGWLRVGMALVILAALPDLLDGALAKASNSSSQRGAFFDSRSTASPTHCCLVVWRGTSPLAITR